MSKPIIPYLIPAIAFLIILIGLFAGCDNINCNPDIKPEDKNGNWYYGWKCGGQW
jgi:hypothetical protein